MVEVDTLISPACALQIVISIVFFAGLGLAKKHAFSLQAALFLCELQTL